MRRAVLAISIAMALVAAIAPATAQPGSPETGPQLDRSANGQQAIRALGEHLPAVARAYGVSAADLREEFRTDPALWTDRDGMLFYVEEAPPRHTDAEAATESSTSTLDSAPYPLSETFQLHSKPGSQRTIHLEFTGMAVGSAWDPAYTGGDGIAEPYDLDGDPTTFSDLERANVQDVWRRMAEDFAAFDVNVTTQDPGDAAITRSRKNDQVYGTRVAFTNSETSCYCYGVAYRGVFNRTSGHANYQPALVFANAMSRAKDMADTASHEVGHNLVGLQHDGIDGYAYYRGHANWSPLMGSGHYEEAPQWSRGEYAGATNTEDDFAVMGTYGAPLRADDHGSASSPTALTTGAPVDGVIEQRTDTDALIFTVEAGTAELAVTPAAVSPNLDVRATLIDASGSELVVADPATATVPGELGGMDAHISIELASGTYRLVVDGVGYGDPSTTGYTDYSSVGAYRVQLTHTPAPAGPTEPAPTDPEPTDPEPAEPAPVVTPESLTAAVSGNQVTLSWTYPSETAPDGYEIQRQTLHRNGKRWDASGTFQAPGDALSFTQSPDSGSHQYRIRAVGATTSEWTSFVTVSVR